MIEKNRYSYVSPSRFSEISQFVSASDRRFIEFGCASGETLNEIIRLNASNQVLGFDLNVNKNIKFDVYECDMDDFDFDKYYLKLKEADIFLFLDVLEHLKEPWKFINELSSHMKQGSKIIITCPNFSSVRFLQAYIKGEVPLEDFGFFDKTHLRWLTPKSFIKALNNKNFKSYFTFLKSKKIIFRIIQNFWPSRLCSQFTLILTFEENKS